jgi:hypothetical protein
MPKLLETYGQWLAAHGAAGALCPCGCKDFSPLIFSTDEVVSDLSLDGGVLYCAECLGAGRTTAMVPFAVAA